MDLTEEKNMIAINNCNFTYRTGMIEVYKVSTDGQLQTYKAVLTHQMLRESVSVEHTYATGQYEKVGDIINDITTSLRSVVDALDTLVDAVHKTEITKKFADNDLEREIELIKRTLEWDEKSQVQRLVDEGLLINAIKYVRQIGSEYNMTFGLLAAKRYVEIYHKNDTSLGVEKAS